MLLHRVLTALVLLPLLIAVVFFAPTVALYALFSVAGAMAALEWAALMSWGQSRGRRLLFGGGMLAFLALLWVLPQRAVWMPWLMGLAALHWLAVLVMLRRYPAPLTALRASPWSALQGLLLIAATVTACAYLHAQPNGAMKLMFVLFLVFAADIGAFLAGRNLGRRKLAPAISPGKTLEGAIGGVLLCAVWALVAGVWIFSVHGREAVWLIVLCVVIAVFSVVGDLLESAFKRLANVKDSGTLLPGHGGVLDRIDSLLAALPLFVGGLLVLGLA